MEEKRVLSKAGTTLALPINLMHQITLTLVGCLSKKIFKALIIQAH
jgi:hypothetical protein